MEVSTVLIILGVLSSLAYIYFSVKYFSMLSAEQKILLTEKAKPGKKVNLSTIVPALLAIVFFKNFYVTLVGISYIAVAIGILSRIHKKSLRDLGFTEDFILRLYKVAYLAELSLSLYAAAALLIFGSGT